MQKIKVPSQLLAQAGIAVAVAAAIFGVSVSPASAFNSPEMPGQWSEAGPSGPFQDDPIETRIEQAIEEVDQEGQDALEELGELDTPEKVARAGEILQHMERTSYEIRKRAHDRTADRFDELNDLAIGRRGDQVRAELRGVGDADTPEKQARAEEIRTRNARIKAQLEERWEIQRQRRAQSRSEQELPQADFRLPNGRPPFFAAAHGLRLRLAKLTEEQADEAIYQLEREGRFASERLGELDTPGKVRRAQKIRAALALRLQDLRQHAAGLNRDADGEPGSDRDLDQIEGVYQERAQELRRRAEAAIAGLGELDTPEKQAQARRIQARLEEALAALRERLGNGAEGAIEERLDRETQSLRRRAEAALDELGELDTPERQETARRIEARLDAQLRKLREQLARRAEAANLQEEIDLDSDGLRRETEVALGELGRLDTPEKVRQARIIRVRMAEAINRLKNQRARQLIAGSGPPSDALTPDVLTDFRENRDPGGTADRVGNRGTDQTGGGLDGKRPADLRERTDRARQAITPTPDRPRPDPEREARPTATTEPPARVKPAVTPEPRKIEPAREVEPAANDSTPETR
jgi:hypothetical protein